MTMAHSILFACNMNSVRSPMAAALLRAQAGDSLKVDSAGVYEGGLDPFVEIVLNELGIPIAGHQPKPMRKLDLAKFDVVIVLTPEAAAEARQYLPRDRIEFWPVENPSDVYGGREEILAAYRGVRDDLRRRLAERFPAVHQKP
jgi:protein-tyrosine-phosphatase